MSGSRSIAAARSRRAGEQANIVSGGRPVTSIASQSAFVQQPYQQQPYQQVNRGGKGNIMQQQQMQQQSSPIPSNGLPFAKLSVSDAIGLITLRLGRVEQFMIDTESEGGISSNNSNINLPENSKIIDNSVLISIVNRLDSLEKKEQQLVTLDKVAQLQNELTNTKEILFKLNSQLETYMKETSERFTDFELGISEIEKVIYVDNDLYKSNNNTDNEYNNDESNESSNIIASNDTNENNTIVSVDLKTVIKEELSRNP